MGAELACGGRQGQSLAHRKRSEWQWACPWRWGWPSCSGWAMGSRIPSQRGCLHQRGGGGRGQERAAVASTAATFSTRHPQPHASGTLGARPPMHHRHPPPAGPCSLAGIPLLLWEGEGVPVALVVGVVLGLREGVAEAVLEVVPAVRPAGKGAGGRSGAASGSQAYTRHPVAHPAPTAAPHRADAEPRVLAARPASDQYPGSRPHSPGPLATQHTGARG